MEKKNIQITTEFIKLDSLLKLSGLYQTGGEAKNAIQAGNVTVNGMICTQRGKKIRIGDRVTVNDQTALIVL